MTGRSYRPISCRCERRSRWRCPPWSSRCRPPSTRLSSRDLRRAGAGELGRGRGATGRPGGARRAEHTRTPEGDAPLRDHAAAPDGACGAHDRADITREHRDIAVVPARPDAAPGLDGAPCRDGGAAGRARRSAAGCKAGRRPHAPCAAAGSRAAGHAAARGELRSRTAHGRQAGVAAASSWRSRSRSQSPSSMPASGGSAHRRGRRRSVAGRRPERPG